jgi:GrpB-like predicted nucleotidyltransferase (UPF0157 family)
MRSHADVETTHVMSDEIEIVDYAPEWQVLFQRLGRSLRGALAEVALRIDHIGSTSVPGLAAKPIIDVQISVASFEPFDPLRLPMERLGFAWRPDNPDRMKRYFREAPGTRRTHIHVRRVGSWSEQYALLFRDYLRMHAEDAAQYAALKREMAERYRQDRAAYTDAKGPFFWETMVKADAWAKEIGWEPGPSDA